MYLLCHIAGKSTFFGCLSAIFRLSGRILTTLLLISLCCLQVAASPSPTKIGAPHPRQAAHSPARALLRTCPRCPMGTSHPRSHQPTQHHFHLLALSHSMLHPATSSLMIFWMASWFPQTLSTGPTFGRSRFSRPSPARHPVYRNPMLP